MLLRSSIYTSCLYGVSPRGGRSWASAGRPDGLGKGTKTPPSASLTQLQSNPPTLRLLRNSSRSPLTRVLTSQQTLAETQRAEQHAPSVPDNYMFHFTCPYETAFGERVVLVGSLPEMGTWKLDQAVELKWHEGHEWKLQFSLPRSRSNFEYKVVVVSDTGGSRWEQGDNRKVVITPEFMKAPLDATVDFRLIFEKQGESSARVLLRPEAVQGPIELAKARLELLDTRRARIQEALSKGGNSQQAKGLEADLGVLEADTARLQAKVNELQSLLGGQALEGDAPISLPTEAGEVSIPSLLNEMLPPLTREYYDQPFSVPKTVVGEASGLEVSIDPSALPLAANGNGAGIEPTAAALAAMQQKAAEEQVRILEEAHRRQVEEVNRLAAAERREAEWQKQVQQQLARAQERQAQNLLAQQRRLQEQQASSVNTASSNAGLEGLAAWISSQYMGMGKSAADALPELRRRGIMCTGRNLFTMPGRPDQVDAEELAQALRLQPRTPSRPSTPLPPSRTAPAPAAGFPTASAAPRGGILELEGLADFIASNYMGMGKSAADALPELRRKGITAMGGQRFSLNGVAMSPPEIAEALRLQARTPSQPVTPSSSRPVSPSPNAQSGLRYELRGASPPRVSPAGSRSGSPSRVFDSELESLAAWISEKYTGMGRSAADTLPELRRRGVMSCGWSLFSLPGIAEHLDAEGVAKALRLQPRPDFSRSSSPSRSTSPIRAPAPQMQLASQSQANTLEGLADFISANYMGMGKSAADALPELRRAGIIAAGNGFNMNGQIMSAAEVANALRLQARTPSRPTTPIPSRPVSPSTSASAASYSAPVATAPVGSPSGLEGLAAWISTNYMGMGKSAADALPELRRKGITASGNSFSMNGQMTDAPGIAQALRLQPRTPSRPTTPIASRPASPAAPSVSYAAPVAPRSVSPVGADLEALQGLAGWISANFMGMGKSAADALPELRRRGIAPVGDNNYSIAGSVMDASGIAQALRLQPRDPSQQTSPVASRSVSPVHARPGKMSPSPPVPPAAPRAASPDSRSSGLEDLAAWISTNYMGMGKSAADALPELRRAGVTAAGNSFSLNGQLMGAPEVAQALRLQARTPSRPTTPIASPRSVSPAPGPMTSYSAPKAAAPAGTSSGLEGLADWISANYAGMGKSAADALPELRRAGVTAAGNSFSLNGQIMGAPEIAQALRLQSRPPSRPVSPIRHGTPIPVSPQAAAPASTHPAPGLSANASGLDSLADFIASNYEGMGKSALDVLPELRRKGIVASGPNAYGIQGRKSQMTAPEIADLLRLKARRGNDPAIAAFKSKPSSPSASYAPQSDSTGRHRVTSPESAEAGTQWLAAWIAQKYMGMGKSAADALPELRRRGIVCSSIKGGEHRFEMAGQPYELSAIEVANLLKLRAR